ncbi:claudin-7 isoform X1 [Pelobates fuscus]|uniref:claudin-7 isoform X1 n=1 Tax=Pelobates fuscus TaxID=191477 RepID=UPI002FE4335E
MPGTTSSPPWPSTRGCGCPVRPRAPARSSARCTTRSCSWTVSTTPTWEYHPCNYYYCVTQSTGQIQCKVYDSILQLDAALQATRALMVVSIVVGICGIAVSTMGMKCTKCGGDDKVKKARIAMTGGFVFLLAGLAALIACSWYGNQIIRDFYNPLTPINTKYEFGAGVFLGWAGSMLVILGGALLACSCPRRNTYSAKGYPKSGARSKAPSTGKEYV